jgi:hypothetical protein
MAEAAAGDRAIRCDAVPDWNAMATTVAMTDIK